MQVESINAMILAAGEGTRLRPLTLETPKPLLPIDGTPLIEHTLNWLKCHGISEVAINLHHLGAQIKNYFGDGSSLNMKIVYSEEDSLLGTSGGVKKMKDFFEGFFVVFYGDNLTDFDLSSMIQSHKENRAVATMALFEVADYQEVGLVEVASDGRVIRLIEKPKEITPEKTGGILRFANAAVYVFNKEVFNHFPEQEVSDFGYDVFPLLLDAGLPVYGYKLRADAYFIDIGSLEKYRQANDDMIAGKVRIGHGE